MKLRSFLKASFALTLLLACLQPAHAQKKKHKKHGNDDYQTCTAKVNKESHVWVIVVVNPRGKITSATIAKSSGDECLDSKGLAMARQQSFPPLEKRLDEGFNNGKPPDRKYNLNLKVRPDAFAAATAGKNDTPPNQ